MADATAAVQYALARLAGLYPEHGRPLRGEIERLSGTVPGSAQQAVLRPATATLDGSYTAAVALAEPDGRVD